MSCVVSWSLSKKKPIDVKVRRTYLQRTEGVKEGVGYRDASAIKKLHLAFWTEILILKNNVKCSLSPSRNM